MLGNSNVVVREMRQSDTAEWLRLRKALWDDSDVLEATAWTLREDAATSVAEHLSISGLVGFAEVGTQAYADGCETSPVAFLEGWYVEPGLRRTGVGARLVSAVGAWGKSQGLHELASDSDLENVTAHAAHLSLGFEEIERSIKYRLSLA